MKQGFWKRFLALVMAIAIVLSTGVLDHAGWLLASDGEGTSQETTQPTTPPSGQQGGSTTETLDLSGTPTDPTVATDPTVVTDPTVATDPTVTTDPTGETDPTDATDPAAAQEVTLTVVLSAVYADESKPSHVLANRALTFGEGVQTLSIEEIIPNVKGYTFAISGWEMVKNEAGKWVATFARPAESGSLYIKVTYSPIVTGEKSGDPTETEPTEPAVTEPTEGAATDPTEGTEAPALTTTLVVISADMGGVLTFEDKVYTYTWAEEETEKTVSFTVDQIPGYAYMVDSEDYTSNGAGTYTGTLARPETSETRYVEVYYRGTESVDPDEILPPSTPIATYTFTADGTVVSTQKVKDGETVFAPEAPQKDGYRFDGWYLGEARFAEGAASVSATETRAYEAKYTQVYYLFFADEQGRVKETREMVTGGSFDTTGHRIMLDNKNLAITGWSLTPVDPNAEATAVGTVTITDHNVILYPITVTAFSITFDTQGGSLMDSAFYYGNQGTVAPAAGATTRLGYTFGGWYTDAACTTAYTFGSKLTQSIVLYAKWNAATDTEYMVIYWQENADDNDYSLKETVTLRGATGAQTAATVRTYSGFTVITEGEKAWSQQTIAGDGSTIVNIYYSRNVYTIDFWDNETYGSNRRLVCGKDEHTHSWRNGCYPVNCNKNHYHNKQSCFNTNASPICGKEAHSHTNSCYVTEEPTPLYTITAKYGANIADRWYTYKGSSIWRVKHNSSPYQANIDTMPLNGTDFWSYTPTGTANVVPYYVEALKQDGSEGTLNNGKYYILHHNDSSNGTATYEVSDEDRYPITGFTVDTSLSSKNGDSYGSAKFYYSRNSYDIVFINDGKTVNTVTKKYQADISDVSYTPTMPADMPEGTTFAGWYTNQLLEGDPYVFSGSMPAKTITLYAKWQEPVHGAQVYFDIILEHGSISVSVPYGEKLEDNLPSGYTSVSQLVQVGAGMTWDGQWLEVMPDGSFRAFFDINSTITRPVRIAPNITSAENYRVSYDLNGGTGSAPSDAKKYYYGAWADVAYASGISKSGKVFLGWSKDASAVAPSWQPGDRIQVSSNVKLYAVWGEVPTATSITYMPNGGTGEEKTYAAANNDTLVVKTAQEVGFSRPGYRFLGWSKSASATAAAYAAGSNIVVDANGGNVLYAVWERMDFNVTYAYTGTVPAGAPAVPGASVATYGNEVTVAAAPTMAGYTFSGWTTDDASVSGGKFTMPEQDVVFTGSWTVRSDLEYTVNYYLNGTTQKVTASKTVSGQTFGKTVSESAVAVGGHTAVAPTSAAITIAESGNVINFYYYQNVTLTAASGTAKYDGTEHSVSGYTASISGASFDRITAGAQGTDAGEYPATFSAGAVGTVSADGKYIVTGTVNGTLTVTRRQVTLTSGTSSREYNGAPLTNGTVTASGDGFVQGQGYTANVTGSVTYPGTVTNAFTYTLTSGTDADNYVITTVPGTLTVTGRDTKYVINIEANSGAYTYDGTEKTAQGFKSFNTTFDGVTYTVSGISASVSGTNVGQYPNLITGTPVVKAPDGTVVTAQFSVKLTDGLLTISPATMTLTASGYEGKYDGAAHGGTVSCSVASAKISYSTDGGATWTSTAPSVTHVAQGLITVQVKAEDPNYSSVTASYTLKVLPRSVTLTSATDSKVYDGTALTNDAITVTGDGFVTGEGYTASVTGSQTNVGESSNVFTYSLTAATQAQDYVISTAEGKLTVTKNGTLTVTGVDYTGIYDAKAHGEAATASVTEGTTLTYSVDGGAYSATVPTITEVGSHTVTVKAVNPNYETATDTYTLTVTPAAVTVTVVGNKAEGIFKGSDYTATGYSIEDNSELYDLSDVAFSGTASVSRTDVGTSPMGLTGEQFSNRNANFTVTFQVTDGSVTVTSKAVTVTADNKTKVYGDDDPAFTATVTGLVGTDTVAYALTREQGQDVGTYVITPAGEATQGNYTVTYVEGQLEITKRPVTVTVVGNTAAVTYNGAEQKVEGFASVEISDELYTEAKFTAPAAVAKGTAVGEYPMGLTAEQFVNNDTNFEVTFQVTDGKLTVTAENSVVVVIRGKTETVTYDGKAHTVTGYEVVSISSELYTVADFSGPSTASVSRTAVGKTDLGLTADQFTNLNANFGTVTFQVTDGYVEVEPLAVTVTITGAKDSKVYNGSEQSVTGYTVSISNPLYTESMFSYEGTKTAKGTVVGTYAMGLRKSDFTNNDDNFTVTFVVNDGSLEITKRAVSVAITGNKDSVIYNGAEQSVTDYEVEISDSLYTEAKIAFSGDATAKGTDIGTYPMGLALSQFSNTDDNFEVTFSVTDGELVITPKAVTVNITGAVSGRVYNGREQSVTGYSVGISDTLYTESMFTYAGDKTAKGTDVGTYPMGLKESDFTNTNENFTVTFVVKDGQLNITRKAITVKILGNEATKVYNGTQQSVTGYEVEIPDARYAEAAIAFSGEAVAKGTAVGTYPMGLTSGQFSNTDTNFEVTFSVTDGGLTITSENSVVVVIRGKTDTVTYDGKAHTVTGYEVVSISSELYTVADFTGPSTKSVSRTEVGKTMLGLTADQFTNNNTNFGTVTFQVTDGYVEVKPLAVTVTITGAKDSKVYNGAEQSVTGYTVSISDPLYKESMFTYSGTKTAKGTDVGTYAMGLKESDFTNNDENFTVTFVVNDGSLEITKLAVSVEITGNKDSVIYNGAEQSVTDYEVEISDSLYTEAKIAFSGDATAKGTAIGTYPMGLALSQFSNTDENFEVTFSVTDGSLEITPKAITVTVTGNTDSLVYNGTEQKVEGYTVSISDPLYKESMFTYAGTKTAKGTDVGTYPMGLKTSDFTNNDDNFTVTFVVNDGSLEITRRQVTLTSATDSKQYDGSALTNDTVTVSGEGFAEGEGVTTNVSGRQTVVGSSQNTFTYSLNAGTKAANYDITTVFGTLTVLNRDAKFEIEVVANSGSFIYDATAKTVSGLKATVFTVNGVDYTVSGLSAYASQTGVGTYPVNVVGTPKVTDPNGVDVTAQFAVSTKAGTLQITKRAVTVTVTGNTGTKIFNGAEQTVADYTVSISDPLYTESMFTYEGTKTARGTAVGQYPMGLKTSDFTNDNANFDVTFEVSDGWLKIDPLAITVTVTENSGSKVYNGNEQSVTGYTWQATSELYTEADFRFSGEAVAKGTDVGTYDMGVKAEDFENLSDNFTVTFEVVDGALEITPVTDEVTVTVTEHEDSVMYDGEAHTVSGYDVSISNGLYTEADFSFSGDDTVSGTDADIYEMELKPEDFENLSDNFTNVTFVIVDGELEITRRQVILTSASDEKIYDGQPLTNSEIELTGDGFVDGEGYTATVTGSQTAEGSSANSFTIELDEGTRGENYDIRMIFGRLTVTALTDEIVVTITEHGGSYVYDGTEHTASGYDVEISSKLYTEADFRFTGSATVSGTDAATYEMQLKPEDFTNISANFTNVTFVIVDAELTIDPAPLTVTTESASKIYDATALTAGGTIEGLMPGETVSFAVTGSRTDVGTSANSYSLIWDGTAKKSNYDLTANIGILTVDELAITVTVTGDTGSKMYNGSEQTVVGYTVAISDPLYTEADIAYSGDKTARGTDVGTYAMGLKAEDFSNTDPNFTVTFVIGSDGQLEVTKRSVTLTSADDTKVYDGTALTNDTVTVSGDGFVAGEGYETFFTGTQTEVGSSANAFTYLLAEGTKIGNYTVSVVHGTLTVTPVTDKVTVTITENSDSFLYDGTEHSVSGYTVEISNELYTEADFSFSGSATVSGTDAGTYEMELKPEDFENLSKNFANVEFVIVDGALEITKRTVTLTSADDEKVYDGTALTNDTVTVSGDGFVDGEGYTASFTGTQTQQGTSANAFTYTLNEGTKAANYDITTAEGTLTVIALNEKITVTVTEHSGTVMYDGEEHTVIGYDVEISSRLYTEADFAFNGAASVSGTDAGTYAMELKSSDFENLSKNFTNVEFVIVDGTLEITKRTLTLTSADDEKVYDGTALTNDTVTVTGDGFVTGEGYTASFTGTQTQQGSSANAFTYTLNEGTKAGNYDITKVEGTLTVTALTEKIVVTVTENSDTVLYDGEEHTVTGYTVEISNELYTEADFTFSGNDSVSGTDVGTYAMELKSSDLTNISKNFTDVEFVIVDGTLEITKRTVTLTSADDSKEYDGTALTNSNVTVSGDGFASGEGYTASFTGTQTDVGTSANAFTYALNEGTKADNYQIEVAFGTLEITPVAASVTVTITEHSGTATYDGEEHTVTGYDVEISNTLYTEADFAFTGDATILGTDAGTYKMELKPADFRNLSANFSKVTFVIVDGTLDIAKRTVTLTSADDTKEYDGTALTNDTVEVTEGSFVEGEGYTTDVTGTQTNVGQSENVFTYTLNEGTKAANYEITLVCGTLKVTDRTDPFTVTVTANSGEFVYDGTEKVVEGFASIEGTGITGDPGAMTFTLNGATFTIKGLSAYEAQTNTAPTTRTVYEYAYGTYTVEVEGSCSITDAKGTDVTAQFALTTVDGTLVIKPRNVTMTSADAEKKYDGTPLTDATVTDEGFVAGEGATYTVSGTQTLIGSSENVFDFTLNANTRQENYVMETVFGTLTVTPPDDFEILDKTHEAKDIFRLGDEVTFLITVENPFSTEATVKVTEQEGVLITDPTTGEQAQSVTVKVAPGGSVTLEAAYTVQEKDLLQGDFTNTVTANIKATVDQIPYEGDDDDDDTVDNIEEPKSVLRLTKTTLSTPANGSKYVEGETIRYQIKVTNEGNITAHDIIVYDVLTGALRSEDAIETAPVEQTFALAVELAPGEDHTFTYDYTVVEEDLGKDLTNAVTGTSGNSSETDENDGNDTPTEVIPDTVTDKTDDIVRELSIEKSVVDKQDIYKLHTYVYYQIVVTNLGNVTERGAVLTDTVTAMGTPDQFSYTDLDGGLLMSGNQAVLRDLAPGESTTVLCRYWIDGKDEDLPVNNSATVDSADGKLTDTDEAETVMVEKLYELTIYYLTDDWQTVLAPEYHGRYSVGHTYYVVSPVLEGYVANYLTIWSGYDGMPENDVVCYVLYTKLPEVTTEPTVTTEPGETTEPTTAPTEPTYDITEIPKDLDPLGDVDLGDHSCCILHFLIMLAAMILLGFYTNDRKKRQAKIHELRRALKAEEAAKEQV